MAHFLGAGGATEFLKALETNGGTPAAQLLPDAAASNRSIFYDGETGRAKSVAEIYRALGSRIEQNASAFAHLDPGGDTAGAASDSTIASIASGAASPAPLNFNGLHLSPPVASMLDTLTLAALRMTADDGAPPQPHDRRG